MFHSRSESVISERNGVRDCKPQTLPLFLKAGTLLILSSCLGVPPAVSSQLETSTNTETEVLVYGKEQEIVEAIERSRDAQVVDTFPNALDYTLSVLLAHAYPVQKTEELVRHTIDAVCKEIESLGHTNIPASQRNSWVDTASQTKSFELVLNEIEAIADGEVKRDQLVNAGLPAMLSATGSKVAGVLGVPQAEWLTNLIEARSKPSEERGLLGIDASDWPTIKVLPDTLAAEAGLRDGDVVLRVNTKDVAEIKTIADALRSLRGATGTNLSMTIERGAQTLTFNIRRESAAERIKASVIDPGIVYIKIPDFEGSGIAMRVKNLVREHVTLTTPAIILDLRDNSAGRPEETNGVADIFLDEKYLQIFQFKNGRRVAFKSKPGSLIVRVILLTNQNTASCAEMLALALHDNRRATVIGQTTAGALCGKEFEKLADGRMITFRGEPTVLSPTGQDYSEIGFPPDIVVDVSEDSNEDEILARAIEFVRSAERKDLSQKPTR
ncbi:S41 family peptidase [Bythopirellula goksoeyrii]|uniref:Putative CtpA-like serine protease n=1 Tax=Bythopirellula goksoeyrii TaxID=1400387 RepID=A0A5B9Q6D8_9BACT|nr:S41 family peptidase [Bythopirellula goksoeyrii]QEG33095.1 putative CtpA-like serine protease [Bythopirellula goksoeyrii]